MKIILFSSFLISLSSMALANKSTEPNYLWQEWYLYSVGDKTQGYYHEDAEKRPADKQIAISQKWKELENGGTETFIGSVAADDNKLTPVAFFSERTNGHRAYKLDARIKNNKVDYTFKLIKPAGPSVKKNVPLKKNMLLSNFLALALAKHDPKKGVFQFEAIVEDSKDGNFESRRGKAEMEGKTKQVRGNTCRLFNIVFDGVPSQWWITKEGKLCQVLIPLTQSELILTTEEEAKKALGSE